jgi:hypothetical protein
MIEPLADGWQAVTLAADKGFDAANFIMELREINVTPHVAATRSDVRPSTDGPRGIPGYAAGQPIRKGFGWMKTIAGLRKSRARKRPMGFHARRRSEQLDQIVKVDVRSMAGTAVRLRDVPKAYRD